MTEVKVNKSIDILERAEAEQHAQEEEEKIILSHVITEHLPHFLRLKAITCLRGDIYDRIIKGVYYNLIGVLKAKTIVTVGQITTDLRMSITIPLPSGQGKKNFKQAIAQILTELEYDVHQPLSFHSQQLIGKVIQRGKGKTACWVQNAGYLSRDYLIFDEAYKMMTAKDEDIQETRRAVRIAKDRYKHNLVEKKMVDNTFDESERLSYYPLVSICQFLQPRRLPTGVVEEGDLRRDLVLYEKGIANADKTEDYAARLRTHVDVDETVKVFCEHLKDVVKKTANHKFKFTEEALSKVEELHLSLVTQGFVHSDKAARFCSMIDWTLQDLLVRLCCLLSAAYGKSEVTPEAVELAYVDLSDFLQMGLDFVVDKVEGALDYGDEWKGAHSKDQKCLEWLYQRGALSEESSKVRIYEYVDEIAKIRGIQDDAAQKQYLKFRSEGWVDSRQEGQHDSKVWLTFKPEVVNRFEGSKGSKGSKHLREIKQQIPSKISTLGRYHPYHPYHPERISEHEVDL